MTRRIALILALCAPTPALAAPDTTTPGWCAALLAGPPPDTLPRAQQVLDCERMTAAAQLDHCAVGIRKAQAALQAAPEPPSRLVWLSIGAAAVAAVWAGYSATR